jgi:hypothetical protein
VECVYPCVVLNTRSASGASLPESAKSGEIDWCVLYRLLIYIMLSREGKYLKIINCLKVVFLLCHVLYI